MKHITIVALFLLIPLSLSAHTAGASLEKQVGDFTIDIGYNPPELTAGEPIRFDFDVRGKGGEGILFDDIWVRITPKEGKGIIFAGAIHRSSFGTSGITFVFGKEGAYELTARFENKDGAIAEATFPLIVEKNPNEKPSPLPLLGVGIGVMLGFFLGKKRSS